MIETDWTESADGVPDLPDEALDIWAEYTEALVRGEKPDMASFLARAPRWAERIRPSMEAAVWLKAEFDSIRQSCAAKGPSHLISPESDSS